MGTRIKILPVESNELLIFAKEALEVFQNVVRIAFCVFKHKACVRFRLLGKKFGAPLRFLIDLIFLHKAFIFLLRLLHNVIRSSVCLRNQSVGLFLCVCHNVARMLICIVDHRLGFNHHAVRAADILRNGYLKVSQKIDHLLRIDHALVCSVAELRPRAALNHILKLADNGKNLHVLRVIAHRF